MRFIGLITSALFIALLTLAGPHGGRAQLTLTGAGCAAASCGGGGGSTVLFDVDGEARSSGTSGAATLDIGSGPNGSTNRALSVAAQFCGANAGTSTILAAVWNVSETLAQIGGPYANGTTGDIYLYGLTNPTTGSHSVTFTWSGANQIAIWALSVVNADQTGGTTTFRNATSNFGTGTANSVPVSSATGDMVMGSFMSSGNYSSVSGTGIGPGIPPGIDNGCANWAAAANRTSGSGTTTMSATAGSGTWIAAGVSIKSH